MHSSLEESWNPDESEPPSPAQELQQKYNKRVQELEESMANDGKIKKFQLQLQLEKLRKWYEIKEHLIEITKEANQIECTHVERRQELIIQIRRRERQLWDLRKLQLKGIKKEKQMGSFIKEQRSTKRTDLTIQEIDELLAGISAMKDMLSQKYGWQFIRKPQIDLSADEFLQDMELFKTDRIKFDFLENNIYHLDAVEQMQYEVEKFKKKHKNGLLDLSQRSYQSLSSSSKKEMLSLRYDKVTSRLPQLSKEIQQIPQTQSVPFVQQLKSTIAISKILTRPINSQHLASPKRRNQPFGFVEDIIANSVSSRILTRKQTTNLTHFSEGESQRKEKRIPKVLENTANSSQERMLKLKNVQKIYYPDIQFDVIREAPLKKQQKIIKRGVNNPQTSIKKLLQHVNQTFSNVIKNKSFSEHKFTKIKDIQKQQLQEATSSLSKASRYQLEEKLDDVWQTLGAQTFGLLQKKVQNMNQQQYTLSTRFQTDQAEEKLHSHKDKLLQKILEQVQFSLANAIQTQDGESQFYEAFRYQIAHQQLSDMQTQVQMSSNIDFARKIFSQQVLNKMSQLMKNYSTQQFKVQIRINQQLNYLIRDTIRTIAEAYEACQQVEKVQLCGKEAAFKQYDKYLRQLDQQSCFWEQLHTLENRPLILQKETLTSEFSQYLDNWIETLFFRLDLKQPQQKIAPLKQQQTQSSIQTSKAQPSPDNRLITAHELFAGLGRDKDELAALQLYTKLATENNSTAQAIMGQILLNGTLGSIDYDQAFNYFKKSADQKNTFSLYHASKLVLEGKVFDKFLEKDDATIISKQSNDAYIRNYDCTFAIALLKKAAELDHLSSMIYLGEIYSNGLTIQEYVLEKDFGMAEFYYMKAKNKNSVQAMHKLAMLYQTMHKQQIYKNRIQKILPLLNQAKNQDYLPAFYDLGILLYQGLAEEIQPNPIMADLILEQGASKGDLKCAQKLLSIRFQALRKEEVQIDDFLSYLDKLEESNKDWTITHYMRGKVFEKGVQIEKNLKKAIEQYKLGALKGCLKCKAQLEKHQKDTMTTEHNNPTNSQLSSLHQRQTNGFIEQIRQSEWRKPFQKSRQVSIGNVQQIFNNAENENLSTIPDRYTRMTISITRPKNQTDDDRKRGASAQDLPLQDIGRSILLSQMKSPEKVHQHSQFWSPRIVSYNASQALSQITDSTHKKKRSNLEQIRRVSQQIKEELQQQKNQ